MSPQPPMMSLPALQELSVPLSAFVEDERFWQLDRLERYYRGTEHDHKEYDWDGSFRGYGDATVISPGWYIPHRLRRPSTRYALAKVIVRRLTSMLGFPRVRCETDPDTEDFLEGLILSAKLRARFITARSYGGAQGCVGLSYGFVNGRPIVEVHKAKHVRILAWRDQSELDPEVVLKAYKFRKDVYDPDSRRYKAREFYYVRLWTPTFERIWESIPLEIGMREDWSRYPSQDIVHGLGRCTFVWITNSDESDGGDGDGDYEGMPELLDEFNMLLSAASKGTRANIDPTLVVMMDPSANTLGEVQKGSDAAIFSPGGAKYLELTGASVQAAREQLEMLRQDALDQAGVVMPSAEKLSGAAQSAAAMRILYAPMLATCTVLREQYGDGLVRLCTGFLELARHLMSTRAPDGSRYELRIPPRVDRELQDDGDSVVKTAPRVPGEGVELSLQWPEFFPETSTDKKAAIETAKLANGNKAVITQRTAVQSIAPYFGIEDVDQELADLEEQAESDLERATRAMGGGPEPAGLGRPGAPPPGAGREDEE